MKPLSIFPCHSLLAAVCGGFFFSACAGAGSTLYLKNGCASCHSLHGKGGGAGPDLTAVAHRRSAGWIADYIKNPAKLNPTARMPAFTGLGSGERRAIARYLMHAPPRTY